MIKEQLDNIYTKKEEILYKLQEKAQKFKKHCLKEVANINWQTRHKNLIKKYEELEEENKELKNQLDKDKKAQKIKEYRATIKKLQEQRENLRRDNIKLMEGLK